MTTRLWANAICLVVVAAAAAFTTTTTTQAAAADASPAAAPAAAAAAASPAAAEFLRGRCSPGAMPEVIASHCYDSLLPQAGTFNGSSIRVIGAAAELMVSNFRSFLAEIQKLNGTNGGELKLGKCAEQAAEFEPEKKEPEKLAKIRALAADGDDGKVEYSYDLGQWMQDVDARFEDCQTELEAVPDADKEKLLPTAKVMYPSILVTVGLISGYTPPQSQM